MEFVYLNKLALRSHWLKNKPAWPNSPIIYLSTFLAIVNINLPIVYVDINFVDLSIIYSPRDAFKDLPKPTFWEAIPITIPAKSVTKGYFLIVYINIYPPSDPPIATGGLVQYYFLIL